MFLAKTWKTVKGRRYESWVLKKAVWDRRHKRYRQVYLAYIGKSRRISLEKAREICEKLGITLDELRMVNRLTIEGERPEPQSLFWGEGRGETPPEARRTAGPRSPAEGERSHFQPERKAEPEESEPPPPPEVPVPTMIQELRRQFGLGQLFQDYQALTVRIGRLHVSPDELRLAEAGQSELSGAQQRQLGQIWRLFVKERGSF